MTKDLIAFSALNKDLQFFMAIGALFHALVASFMNVHVDFWETPSSINLLLVIDLELRMPSINSDFFIAKLWLGNLLTKVGPLYGNCFICIIRHG